MARPRPTHRPLPRAGCVRCDFLVEAGTAEALSAAMVAHDVQHHAERYVGRPAVEASALRADVDAEVRRQLDGGPR